MLTTFRTGPPSAEAATDAFPPRSIAADAVPVEAAVEPSGRRDLNPDQDVTDAVLLRRFVRERDPAAFAAIVTRYERLVMGVAQRQVGDRHRAEDVFQATFLVLAERAGRIRNPGALACWLHGTARRLGLKALSDVQRTQTMTEAVREPAVDDAAFRHLQEAYERQALDTELANLPESLRLPLVVHYLEGLTGREVAARLELSVDTVEGRLRRGCDRLRERLVRHGIGLGAALVVFQATQQTAMAASAGLSATTTSAALAWVNHQSLGACSANAVRLAGQELATMTTTKATIVASLAAALCLGTGTVGGLALGGGAGGPSGVAQPVSTGVATPGSTGHSSGADPFGVDSTSEQATLIAEGERGDPQRAEGREETIELLKVQTSGSVPGGNYFRMSPSRQAIETALERPGLPLDFVEVPLFEIAAYLSDLYAMPVKLDTDRLTEYGIESDLEVTITTPPAMTVRESLEAVLEKAAQENLDYIVRPGRLIITTREFADGYLETIVYGVRDLEPTLTSEEVASLVQDGTSEGWLVAEGGSGSIASLPGGLQVRAPQRVHREVAQLLDQLRRFANEGHATSLPSPQSVVPHQPDAPAFVPTARQIP